MVSKEAKKFFQKVGVAMLVGIAFIGVELYFPYREHPVISTTLSVGSAMLIFIFADWIGVYEHK